MKPVPMRATARGEAPAPGSRTAIAIIAAVALALLVAACSSSPSSTGSGGSPGGTSTQATGAQLVAFSHCMRSDGVSNYPDPTSGQLPKESPELLGVSDTQFTTAQNDCVHLLPPGSNLVWTGSNEDSVMSDMLKFAQCMRSHGVPNWPDPTNGSAGPGFNLVGIPGNWSSPQIDNLMTECQHVLPKGVGVPLSRPGHPG